MVLQQDVCRVQSTWLAEKLSGETGSPRRERLKNPGCVGGSSLGFLDGGNPALQPGVPN